MTLLNDLKKWFTPPAPVRRSTYSETVSSPLVLDLLLILEREGLRHGESLILVPNPRSVEDDCFTDLRHVFFELYSSEAVARTEIESACEELRVVPLVDDVFAVRVGDAARTILYATVWGMDRAKV